MENIWIKRNRDKVHTLEIAKNAIFRFGPMKVTKLLNLTSSSMKLDLGETSKLDLVALAVIRDDIVYTGRRNYYGKLKTTINSTETKRIEMNTITKVAIDFEDEHVILSIYFV